MSDADVPVSGVCRDDLLPVQQAFRANFTERGEVGGAVCVIIDGEVVIDLVGGWSDAARTQPWTADTLVNIYSAGKGVLTTLALQLVDRGELELDAPIGALWPEFACAGKERATVRHAFTHQAGVPAIREPLTNDDLWKWDRMVGAVAATEAWFEPGTQVVYHTNTYGHLLGEILRRAGGLGPADALRRLATDVDADIWYALPPDVQARCAEVLFEPPAELRDALARNADSVDGVGRMILLAYTNPPGYGSSGVANSPEWRGAEIPAANAHATARGLAQLYAALLVPDRVISPALLAEATRVQAAGPCPVLGEYIEYGLGFVPTSARRRMGTNPRSFGHFGSGGAVGFADPDAGVAFGYVMNHVIPRWQSTRNRALIDSLYAVL
ncbi:MAG TPA: serine hydrolase domain-containing protein [Acidimicrobiia bacterium]|nr:serine hydrolase domain-containing protein [Acidimicrobiia bacterium]